MAYVAGNVNIGQEVHFNAAHSVALTRLASAALYVEREPSRLVAAHVRIAGGGKKLAYIIEKSGICRRVGARRASYRTLVDVYHLVKKFNAFNAVAVSGAAARAVERRAEHRVYDAVHERGFSRAGYAGNADEAAERDAYIDIFEVVLARTVYGEKMSVPRAALLGHRDHPSAGKICAGKRIGVCRYLLGSARGDNIAAVDACAGTYIHDIIRPAHHILVMLNDYHRVAEVA